MRKSAKREILKAPTGIQGLDEITQGGVPKGRATLICGDAGCGKTLMAMEFLVRGATEFDEPGVFMAFEETAEELTENVRSLGFNLDDLVQKNRLCLDHVHVERSEIEEDWRIRLGRPVHPARAGHRFGRRQAGRARHPGNPL